MQEAVLETIREHDMIHAGEAIAVACSGGADSTALLLLLRELSEPLGCVLSVAHLNHALRGGESDADEEFVRQLAQRLGLACFVERADPGRIVRQPGRNLEAAARAVRMEFFAALIKARKADGVALAHTADDQAETVLQRLLRGAGLRGLAGIHPVVGASGGALRLIRPLLRVRRAAIRRWLQQRGERWREDSSNRDRRLTRNRIRHEVLPLLEQFNPRLVETLAHTAAIARAEEAFWESYIQPLCASWVRWENEQAMIAIERLREAPPAVACRVLRWAVAQVRQAGRPEPLRPPPSTDFQHIEGLLRWSLHGQSGQSFSLPRQVEARKEFEHLILVARKRETGVPGTELHPESYCYPVKVPGSVTVPGLGVSFRFDFVTLGEGQPRYNEQGRILLDAKLADSPLTLRNWQAGDAYQPEGHRSPKKLQDLFQRLRIPVRQRAKWPVLWAAENIVWVRGLAVAAGSSPAPGSSRAIEIREVA